MTQEENLNLADLNLKKLKLSDEDALALSYLTPGLSRRIQQQLLAQLAPREARKLHRTMSSRIPEEREHEDPRPATATLPRNLRAPRSFLPVKRDDARPSSSSYDFAVRSSSIGAEPRGDSRFLHQRLGGQKAAPKSPEPLEGGYSGAAASRPYSKYSKGGEPPPPPEGRFKPTLESPTSSSSDRPSKRISRFLRPDFFDPPKEENVYLKEKKEREMETQKVLKEIRDKRRSRMRRERSQSKEKQAETSLEDDKSRRFDDLGNGLEYGKSSEDGLGRSNAKYPVGCTEPIKSRSLRDNLEQSKTRHLEDSLRHYLDGGLEQSKSTSLGQIRMKLNDPKYSDSSLEQNRSKRYEDNSERNKGNCLEKGSLEDDVRQDNPKYLDKTRSSRVGLDQKKTEHEEDGLRQNCLDGQSKSQHLECNYLENNPEHKQNKTKHSEDVRQKYSYSNLEQTKSKRLEDHSEQKKGNYKERSPKDSLEQSKTKHVEDTSRQNNLKYSYGGLEQNKPKRLEDNPELAHSDMPSRSEARKRIDGSLEQNKSKRLEDNSEQNKANHEERSPKDSLEQTKTKHLEDTLRQTDLKYSCRGLEQNKPKRLEGMEHHDVPSSLDPRKHIDSSLEQNRSKRLEEVEHNKPNPSDQERTKHPDVNLRLNVEQNKSKHPKDNPENSLDYSKERQKRRQPENGADRTKKEEKSEKLHSYVNVPGPKVVHDYVNVKAAPKASKIARPKSYPIDSNVDRPTKSSPDKESKISRLRKGFTSKQSKERTNETNKSINEEEKQQHKNKLLHSIEKKLEKLRSGKESDEKSGCGVENAIKRLREQSLPRNIEPCTESGLIKRAVSVEDLTGSKPLQTSRKSVTKILGLFKKYEEQDNNNKKKAVKKVKSKDKAVINNNNNNDASESSQSSERSERRERPRSLFFEKVKQHVQDGSDGVKTIKSKLPVNSYRRSLNLEPNGNEEEVERPSSRRGDLRLELGKAVEDRASLTATTDDSSTATLLSPSDDYLSCDSWSVCSELHSPLSPNGNVAYSGDEGESVIDRIRRKSFYTRFNEKRRSRRPTSSFKDLEPSYRRSTSVGYPSSVGPLQESPARSYATRSGPSSLLNDYINVPGHYRPYGARAQHGGAVRSEEDALDELISNAKAKKYSSQIQPSRLGRTSGTPVNDYYMPRSPSSEPI